MADTTNNDSIVKGLEESMEYASPGDLGLAQIKDQEKIAARKESDAQAELEWKRSGVNQFLNALYDHKQAYAEGNVDFTKALPNKFYKPGQLQIAGRDFITGRHSFGPRSDTLDEGVRILRDSSFIPGKPLPIADIGGLAKVATEFARGGRSFDDFRKNVPLSYDLAHMKAAWSAGLDANGMEALQKKFSGPGLAWNVPAQIEFAELMASKEWAGHARTIYKFYGGREFGGTDIEAAQWLASHWRNFDFNSVAMAATVANATRGTPELQQAYAKSLELWNITNMEPSFKAQLGNGLRMVLDPANILGASVGKLTLMTAGRKAFGDLLKRLGTGAAIGGTIGAAHESGLATISGKEQDPARIATSAASGAVAVGGLFGAVPEALAAAGVARNYLSKGNAAITRQIEPLLRGTVLDPSASFMVRAVPDAPKPAHDPVTGFYSPVERAIAESKQEKGTIEQIINSIKGQKGVTDAELLYLDLYSVFPPGTKVSKAQVLDHISTHKFRLEETRLGANVPLAQLMGDTRQAAEVEYNNLREVVRPFVENTDPNLANDLGAVAEDRFADFRDFLSSMGLVRPGFNYEDVYRMTFDEYAAAHIRPRANSRAPFADYTAGGKGQDPAYNYRIFSLRDPQEDWFEGRTSHIHGPNQSGQLIFARTTDRNVLAPRVLEYPDAPLLPTNWGSAMHYDLVNGKLVHSTGAGPAPIEVRINNSRLYVTNHAYDRDKEFALAIPEMRKYYLEALSRDQNQEHVFQIVFKQEREPNESNNWSGIVTEGVFDVPPYRPPSRGRTLHADELQSDFFKEVRRARAQWEARRRLGDVEDISYEQNLYKNFRQEMTSDLQSLLSRFPAQIDNMINAERAAQLEDVLRGLPDKVEDLTKNQREFLEAAAQNQEEAHLRMHYLEKNIEIVTLKRLLYQAALEGKDYMSWASREALYTYEGSTVSAPIMLRSQTFMDVYPGALSSFSEGLVDVRNHLIKQGYREFADALKAGMLEADRTGRNVRVPVPRLTDEERAIKLDELGTELTDWAKKKGVVPLSADEMLYQYNFVGEDRVYLNNFIERWDRAERKIPEIELAPAKKPYLDYDTKFVNEMNKFLKSYGSKVEQVEVEAGGKPAWSIKITPELRKRLLEGGVNLSAIPLNPIYGGQGAETAVA